MKAFIAAALVALGLFSTTVGAQAASQYYSDYPQWARHAFDAQG